MPRYRFLVEYDGTPFAGWQRQDNFISVQGVIEQALKACTGEEITLRTAGRTDAGVHALMQVTHFDLAKDWPAKSLQAATQAHLIGFPVALLACHKVDSQFDSRFMAIERRYLYRILNRQAPPALLTNRVWHLKRPLDLDKMRQGARYLIGTYDFTTFRASNCQAKSPVRTLDDIAILASGEEIHLYFRARSFLHRQVRSLSGSLADVGHGRYPPEWLRDSLKARSRAACGVVAPARGLYLIGVSYAGEDFGLPFVTEIEPDNPLN